jgi:hypothetical protein
MSLLREIIRGCRIKRPSIYSRLIALLVGLLFGGGGLLMFITDFLNPLRISLEAKNWVSVAAVVLKSELEQSDESVSINLKYRYIFEGNEYQNDQFELSEGGRNFSTDTYYQTVKNYPRGSEIPIWVNPHKPEQSVYKREMVITNWIALPFSIPFLTAGICGILYMLLGGIFFRVQQQARKEAAQIASRHAAFEVNKDLLDENFHARERASLNFLKREKLGASLGYLFAVLFINGIVSVFLILAISMHINGNPLAYPLSIFLIPFVIVGLNFIRKFLTFLFAGKGDDYVITSEWDYEYTQVTHHWLLLNDQQNALELGLLTCATENSKDLKKILRNIPFTDVFKAPDKSVITGTIVHRITGSSQKEINLLIHTKSKSKKKYNQHQLNLYTPDIS